MHRWRVAVVSMWRDSVAVDWTLIGSGDRGQNIHLNRVLTSCRYTHCIDEPYLLIPICILVLCLIYVNRCKALRDTRRWWTLQPGKPDENIHRALWLSMLAPGAINPRSFFQEELLGRIKVLQCSCCASRRRAPICWWASRTCRIESARHIFNSGVGNSKKSGVWHLVDRCAKLGP